MATTHREGLTIYSITSDVCRAIGALSVGAGKAVSWLVPVIIFCITYEVVARAIFNASTVWSYGLSSMTGATLYAMGLAYVWRRGGHVRIDLIRDHFPSRFKDYWEIALTAVFFLPIVGALAYVSSVSFVEAFVTNELNIETLWMPPTWPYKFFVAAGFILFFLEGVNHLLRNILKVAGKEVRDGA